MPQKYRLHITGMLQLDYISIRILLQICYIVYVVRQLVGEAIRKMKYILRPFEFVIRKDGETCNKNKDSSLAEQIKICIFAEICKKRNIWNTRR